MNELIATLTMTLSEKSTARRRNDVFDLSLVVTAARSVFAG